MVTIERCVMCDRTVRAPGEATCSEACFVAYRAALRLQYGRRLDDDEEKPPR